MAIGDRLRSVMTLWGAPSCAYSAACVMVAGEKGLDLKTLPFDPDSSEITIHVYAD